MFFVRLVQGDANHVFLGFFLLLLDGDQYDASHKHHGSYHQDDENKGLVPLSACPMRLDHPTECDYQDDILRKDKSCFFLNHEILQSEPHDDEAEQERQGCSDQFIHADAVQVVESDHKVDTQSNYHPGVVENDAVLNQDANTPNIS